MIKAEDAVRNMNRLAELVELCQALKAAGRKAGLCPSFEEELEQLWRQPDRFAPRDAAPAGEPVARETGKS